MPAAGNVTKGCVERFDAAADYFPEKAVIEDAATFAIEYRRSYKVVTVKEGYPGGPAERYVLVQCGTPAPKLTGDLAAAQVVTVPITSLFVFSTTHLSLLADLNRFDVLAGVARNDVVMDPQAEARIKAGKVVEFAKVGLVIDVERIVTARPSVVMAGGTSTPTLGVIRSAGVPVVANTEWLEGTAVARAEWLKYLAVFLNEERKAQTLYGAMKERYRSLSRRATVMPDSERPLVMTGRSTRGQFVIAGGRSYVAALIKDAGGRYAWAHVGRVDVGRFRSADPARSQRRRLDQRWRLEEPRGHAGRRAEIRRVQSVSAGAGVDVRTPADAARRQRLLVAQRDPPGHRAGGPREDFSPCAGRRSFVRMVHGRAGALIA
jgi:iron complex transport system substrate-binding protein